MEKNNLAYQMQNRAFEKLENIPDENEDELDIDSIIMAEVIANLIGLGEEKELKSSYICKEVLKDNFISEITDTITSGKDKDLNSYLNTRYNNVEAFCISNGLLELNQENGIFIVNSSQLKRMVRHNLNNGYVPIKRKKTA